MVFGVKLIDLVLAESRIILELNVGHFSKARASDSGGELLVDELEVVVNVEVD